MLMGKRRSWSRHLIYHRTLRSDGRLVRSRGQLRADDAGSAPAAGYVGEGSSPTQGEERRDSTTGRAVSRDTPFLAVELLKSMVGIDAVPVTDTKAARGAGRYHGWSDLVMIENVARYAPLCEGGQLRALASTKRQRLPLVPQTDGQCRKPGGPVRDGRLNGLFVPEEHAVDIVGKLNAVWPSS